MISHSMRLRALLAHLQSQRVLVAAWVLALFSAFAVPPDRAYGGYVDYRTLCLLFSLMVVMAGLQQLGVFQRIGIRLLRTVRTSRQLEAVLIFLCFFSSMFITNDVSLLTFVPFSCTVLRLADQQQRLPFVVVMQTIAANLGSILLPIGNPQNLYLYTRSGYSLSAFVYLMLPYAAAAGLLLAILLLVRRSVPLNAPVSELPATHACGKIAFYGLLFFLCLLTVANWIPYPVTAGLVLFLVLLVDRHVLRRVDYTLLLTFVGFFLFVGNLQRIGLLHHAIAQVVQGHEMITAVLISQIISNVPAALLLSGFTEQWDLLLVGVNVGGLGTLIASMASLISYKYVSQNAPAFKKTYFRLFTGMNLIFLMLLLLLYALLQ